jgi:hypothetical protein
MDIERIVKSRQLKATRAARPYDNFRKLYIDLTEVAPEVQNADLSEHTKGILEKHSVITLVTAVEVYFRDMLDSIFRLCKPETFEGFLREFHKVKYDIEELIAIYKKNTHPLELVVDGCNFKNSDVVNSVFNKLLGKPLWETVFSYKFRVKDTPEKEYQADKSHLLALKRSTALRHELIHNPDLTAVRLTEMQRSDLHSASFLVLCCDFVLSKFVSDNLDDEFREKAVPKS